MPVTNQPKHLREVKTYKLRKSRVSTSQAAAIAELGDDYLWASEGGMLKLPQDISENCTDVVVEIGFGMGEATAALALSQPELAVLALDLHTPGVGKLITRLHEQGSSNVRIIEGDALEVLAARIPDN
ncbi:MAG: hypothetical protein RL038_149, partial [Actinomycetota bacterium]